MHGTRDVLKQHVGESFVVEKRSALPEFVKAPDSQGSEICGCDSADGFDLLQDF